MSLAANMTLAKINASAEQRCYQNTVDIRTMIMNYWMGDLVKYKQCYKKAEKYINENTGLWARIKTCFGWHSPELAEVINYRDTMCELMNLYETRQRCLMSEDFLKNLISDCPICLEPMLGQAIVLPDCLHPLCSGCFVNICRGYATYQCPMRCHVIKYVYPLTIHMSKT
jgi:hypothetical protein